MGIKKWNASKIVFQNVSVSEMPLKFYAVQNFL